MNSSCLLVCALEGHNLFFRTLYGGRCSPAKRNGLVATLLECHRCFLARELNFDSYSKKSEETDSLAKVRVQPKELRIPTAMGV